MTPTDCLLQNLENGPLTYTKHQHTRLGADVRGAAVKLLNDALIEQVWETVLDETVDPPVNVEQVTWTIRPAGVERMELLRNPPVKPDA